MFTSDDEGSVLLAYLLASEEQKELMGIWYSYMTYTAKSSGVPYIREVLALNDTIPIIHSLVYEKTTIEQYMEKSLTKNQ